MTYKSVPLDIVGPTYTHRSLPISAQSCKNMYPEITPLGASQKALLSWPGAKAWSTGTGADRGMRAIKEVLYKVHGTTLYTVDSNGNQTSRGTIAGSGQCVIEGDGTNVIIVTGSNAYQYVVSTATLTTITDADYEQGNSVAFLNSQMIFDGTGGRFCVADAGDPDAIDALNYATAESSPDDLIRVFVHKEQVAMFGERSIEHWYNSGTGNPPFDKISQATVPVGLSAVHSVAQSRDFMYFLGHDRSVYKMTAYTATPVTPPPVANEFEGYTTVSDAKGYVVRIQGQHFYVLTFPSENKTFAYNEDSDAWFQLTNGNDEDRYIGNSYAYCYGKHLVADHNNGNIYELDEDTFTDNSTTIIRERISGPITSIGLGNPGMRLQMSGVDLLVETGVGIASGQGSNPKIMFSASFDGGKSWTSEDWIEIGRTGDGRKRVRWDYVDSFYEAMIRIRISDPVNLMIYSAAIELQYAGW